MLRLHQGHSHHHANIRMIRLESGSRVTAASSIQRRSFFSPPEGGGHALAASRYGKKP